VLRYRYYTIPLWEYILNQNQAIIYSKLARKYNTHFWNA